MEGVLLFTKQNYIFHNLPDIPKANTLVIMSTDNISSMNLIFKVKFRLI